MITTLNAVFNKERSDFKNIKILVENLVITDENITFDSVSILLDENKYSVDTPAFHTWAARNLSEEELFYYLLNAFIKNDFYMFKEFGEEWNEVFESVVAKKVFENNLLMAFPYCYYGDFITYDLVFATPEFRYYNDEDPGDNFLMLSKEGYVSTDMESFYMEGITEDLVKVLKGEIECLYMNGNTKDWIEQSGSKDGFIREWS